MEKRSDKSCCFLQSVFMGITSVVEWLASADWIVLSYLIRHCIYDFIIVMTSEWELRSTTSQGNDKGVIRSYDLCVLHAIPLCSTMSSCSLFGKP